ncbi:MAG TPA: IclR family transcriptional regulator C-terminal domain-containing protein [Acidimicrobiales bacterium]
MSRPEFIQSLERGLRVIRCFDAEHPALTLSEVATRADLTRATARRLLLTLEELGYVSSNGRRFALTPRVLDIGYAYLSSLNVQQIAQPYLEALSERVNESVSVTVLDEADIIYVARVPTTRIMTISLGLGSRLPAHCTSMGRVLLAELPTDELRAIVPERLEPRTEHTIRTRAGLEVELARVREQGWAMVDQELELGVRSIAAPLRDSAGRAVAAMNVSTHAGRTTVADLHEQFLPALVATAQEISDAIAKR